MLDRPPVGFQRLVINWQTMLTLYEISDLVKVAYCSAPTMAINEDRQLYLCQTCLV